MSEWKDIPGWEGIYQASSDGLIRALDRELTSGRWGNVTRKGGLMKPKVGKLGYQVIGLRLDGKRFWYGVHRLVCMAFHGPPPDGKPFATHFPDRDRLNCRADNLRWASAVQNSADKVFHGTNLSGEKNPMAKLSEEDAECIRKEYRRGRPCHPGNQSELARRFGVGEATIRNVANGIQFSRPDYGCAPMLAP